MHQPMNRRAFLKMAGLAAVSTCLSPPRAQAGGYWGAGVPESALSKLEELHDQGEVIRQVAFAPDNGWVILYGRNGNWRRDIPEKAAETLAKLNWAKKIYQHISFSPDGGYIFFFTENNQFQDWTSHGMPGGLIRQLRELNQTRTFVKQVAFTKKGGWVILHGFNGFVYDDIPDEAVAALRKIKREYLPLRNIAFTEDGGWSILYGTNAYWTSGVPRRANEKLKEWNQDGKRLLSANYIGEGEWLLLLDYDSDTKYWVTQAADGSKDFPPIHAYAHNFGDAQKRNRILAQALNVLHTRFRDLRIARNSYQISREAYFIDDDYWKLCNVAAHPTYGPRELLWYQLETLRLPNSAMEDDDEGPPFPELHLFPYYEEDNSWGKAFLNRVIVKYVNGPITRRTGDFVLFLNNRHLGDSGDGSDPSAWATVMGHELLHNLGHHHGPGNYTDARQINCFHRALYCNGTYDGRKHVPGFG
jgi:hypothetical protein